MNTIIHFAKTLFKDAFTASMELFKVMVPILIAVKALQEMDVIQYLAWPLEPIMSLVGLPAEMGLVWATAIINNIYTGLIVLASLIGDNPLTSAQATVLGVLMLVAHGLPVECAIAKRSGVRFLFQALARLTGAFVFAWALHLIYSSTGTLQGQATLLFQADQLGAADPSLAAWALGQAKNLISIFCIILSLLMVMRLLHAIRVIDLLNRILRPVLNVIGIGPKASAITVIGLTMGLSYGGGLIISEAKSGNVGKEDIFYSLTLMGLCHSLIEDTLLITLMGGHISGILWARLGFSILAMAGIVQIVRRLPAPVRNRYLWADA
ncbi:hypothetical protein GM415_12275 [Pseudodesulfovibrio cashew]|uniref:Nucleoside recognition protein n=1 Tax=Pseudodesulfovibrio cashew TaxID=2678688 RepID=A0A6I6JFB5_9BACT|nr:hypothetical protein [Pseudodesulfovibrio cashew]QGY40871.1 hypothetical protein GM415_12275 [Pseudodesulfovibrio cashew]